MKKSFNKNFNFNKKSQSLALIYAQGRNPKKP